MRFANLLVVVSMFAPLPAGAQMSDPAGAAESRERVAALGWLVGEWQGDGWVMVQGAGRQTFTSTEVVESRLDGRLLLVEGVHHDAEGNVVHNALGAITWDAEDDRFVFHTWLGNAGGGGADNALELTEQGFRWSPRASAPDVTIVFEVRHENEAWVETGTVSLPDGRSFQFFEMRLRRTAGSQQVD